MNILFVHNHPSTFVRQDMNCLRIRHKVTELHLISRRVDPVAIWRLVSAHDFVFGWFASWHTFLPVLFSKILNKPSALVIGGYDLANNPEIGYGHQRGGIKKWVSRATICLSSRLITNSWHSEKEARENAGLRSQRVHVVYHGIPDLFGELPRMPRARMAITIGNVDKSTLQRKGLVAFVRAARSLPDVRFVVIGAWKDSSIDYLRALAGPNVEFTGWVDEETLMHYCQRASVSVQASLHEGFGMAVAETMLGGCIPVVTSNGALPEVAGECGVYADSTQPDNLARAISTALDKPAAARMEARRRILTHFPVHMRHNALLNIVSHAAGTTSESAAGNSHLWSTR